LRLAQARQGTLIARKAINCPFRPPDALMICRDRSCQSWSFPARALATSVGVLCTLLSGTQATHWPLMRVPVKAWPSTLWAFGSEFTLQAVWQLGCQPGVLTEWVAIAASPAANTRNPNTTTLRERIVHPFVEYNGMWLILFNLCSVSLRPIRMPKTAGQA
jgi:hypothetical protein